MLQVTIKCNSWKRYWIDDFYRKYALHCSEWAFQLWFDYHGAEIVVSTVSGLDQVLPLAQLRTEDVTFLHRTAHDDHCTDSRTP